MLAMPTNGRPDSTSGAADPALEATADLLVLARANDATAVNVLFARYLPELRRWTSGRLPRWARDLAETQDLVQDTLLQVFRKLDGFEYRGEGAFRAYLQQAVMNRLRNEIRRASRRPVHEEVDAQLEHAGPSPVDRAIGFEVLDRYERALGRLAEADREAVIGRVELGLSYAELARRLEKPSPDAARMAVARALIRLADDMKD
jgi:RNA polymerase sigma factor (sigma-70 family)